MDLIALCNMNQVLLLVNYHQLCSCIFSHSFQYLFVSKWYLAEEIFFNNLASQNVLY